jgi:hypothetical protein
MRLGIAALGRLVGKQALEYFPQVTELWPLAAHEIDHC